MKDAASRIADKMFQVDWDGRPLHDRAASARIIRSAIRRAVKAERERCVVIILESDTPGTPGKYERQYMLEAIVEKITTPAKKGNKRKGRR
jgi:hypothetical protein